MTHLPSLNLPGTLLHPVAADPHADERALTALARHAMTRHRELTATVAGNPATPPGVIEDLLTWATKQRTTNTGPSATVTAAAATHHMLPTVTDLMTAPRGILDAALNAGGQPLIDAMAGRLRDPESLMVLAAHPTAPATTAAAALLAAHDGGCRRYDADVWDRVAVVTAARGRQAAGMLAGHMHSPRARTLATYLADPHLPAPSRDDDTWLVSPATPATDLAAYAGADADLWRKLCSLIPARADVWDLAVTTGDRDVQCVVVSNEFISEATRRAALMAALGSIGHAWMYRPLLYRAPLDWFTDLAHRWPIELVTNVAVARPDTTSAVFEPLTRAATDGALTGGVTATLALALTTHPGASAHQRSTGARLLRRQGTDAPTPPLVAAAIRAAGTGEPLDVTRVPVADLAKVAGTAPGIDQDLVKVLRGAVSRAPGPGVDVLVDVQDNFPGTLGELAALIETVTT